jgi:Plant transposon protein
LRCQTREEAQKISIRMSCSGFPGCIGSLDFITLEWTNCQAVWSGYYKERGIKPSLILKAVADDQLYCWRAFFGMPGSSNDINVLYSSTFRSAWVAGQYPPQFEFIFSSVIQNLPYLLVDGIYPRYRTFISTENQSGSQKEKSLYGAQETRRKDTERHFGVLQAIWEFLKTPCGLYIQEYIGYCVNACILQHNMIIR